MGKITYSDDGKDALLDMELPESLKKYLASRGTTFISFNTLERDNRLLIVFSKGYIQNSEVVEVV